MEVERFKHQTPTDLVGSPHDLLKTFQKIPR
jgi:hypothetical protein